MSELPSSRAAFSENKQQTDSIHHPVFAVCDHPPVVLSRGGGGEGGTGGRGPGHPTESRGLLLPSSSPPQSPPCTQGAAHVQTSQLITSGCQGADPEAWLIPRD